MNTGHFPFRKNNLLFVLVTLLIITMLYSCRREKEEPKPSTSNSNAESYYPITQTSFWNYVNLDRNSGGTFPTINTLSFKHSVDSNIAVGFLSYKYKSMNWMGTPNAYYRDQYQRIENNILYSLLYSITQSDTNWLGEVPLIDFNLQIGQERRVFYLFSNYFDTRYMKDYIKGMHLVLKKEKHYNNYEVMKTTYSDVLEFSVTAFSAVSDSINYPGGDTLASERYWLARNVGIIKMDLGETNYLFELSNYYIAPENQ